MFKLHPAESKLFQLVCVGFYIPLSAAASGRAGWALAHPEFGSSVNPITTRGADYAHHITASPPRFEIPAASLQLITSQLSCSAALGLTGSGSIIGQLLLIF